MPPFRPFSHIALPLFVLVSLKPKVHNKNTQRPVFSNQKKKTCKSAHYILSKERFCWKEIKEHDIIYLIVPAARSFSSIYFETNFSPSHKLVRFLSYVHTDLYQGQEHG